MADNKDNNISFLDEGKKQKIHIKDILFTILRNIHWLVLCGAIGTFVAGYYVRHQDRVYESSARLLIKGSSVGNNNTESSIREASVKNMFSTRSLYNSSINNEMMILTSEVALREVAKNLKLNIVYTTKTRLVNRNKDLYGESPYTIDFIDDNDEASFQLDIVAKDDSTVSITPSEGSAMTVPFEDTVASPFGRIVVHKTFFFTNDYKDHPVKVIHNNLNATAENYRNALQVSRDNDMNTIVNIVLRDASPIRAAEVINEVIRVYNEDAVKDKKRIINETYEYINSRLATLHADLSSKENEIASFKRDNQLLDISSFGQSYLESTIQSGKEIDHLDQQISQARDLVHINQAETTPQMIPGIINLDSKDIMSYVEKYNNLVIELKNYEGTPNSPVVKSKHEELRNMRTSMNILLEEYIRRLQERKSEVQIAAESASSKMSQVPRQQLYLENLTQQQKIKEDLYLHLLSRREELLISQPSIEPNGKILNPAGINREPVAPNETLITLLGLVLGLAIPVGIFFLRRSFDTKVKYHSDIVNTTTIPFLCEIPGKDKKDDRNIVVSSGDHDSLSESFRLLRTKIDFLSLNDDTSKSRVVMITSMLPAMGKTFVSSNTAASLGISGKKVIILDLDLRKGSLTRTFYSRKHAGLTHYLSGKTDDWKSLVKSDLINKGVDALFTGPIPPNPSELLGNGKLDKLIA